MPGGALGAAVARIGAIARERNGPGGFQFLRGGFHQQPDFPMAGVIAQRDRSAVAGANAAMGAEDQDLGTAQLLRIPTHAGILREAEQIAGRPVQQHLGGNRQRALRACAAAAHVEQAGIFSQL